MRPIQEPRPQGRPQAEPKDMDIMSNDAAALRGNWNYPTSVKFGCGRDEFGRDAGLFGLGLQQHAQEIGQRRVDLQLFARQVGFGKILCLHLHPGADRGQDALGDVGPAALAQQQARPAQLLQIGGPGGGQFQQSVILVDPAARHIARLGVILAEARKFLHQRHEPARCRARAHLFPGLFGFGDIFGDLLRGIADLGGEAWDIIKGVIKEAVGLPSDLLNGLLGGFSGVLILVALGLCAISIALVAYLKCQMNRLDRKIEMLSMPRVPMGTAGRKGRRTRETTKLLNDM